MDKDNKNNNKTSIWKNTAIIVAIIGLIGTIISVTPAIIQIIISKPSSSTTSTSTSTAITTTSDTINTATTTLPPAECYDFNAEIPEILPLSLKNSIESQEYLYWFRLEAINNCDRTLHLNVTFEPELDIYEGKAWDSEFSLEPGKSVKKKVSPEQFKLLQSDIEWPIPIKVKWKVFDDTQKKLRSDTKKITVLAKNIIKWDLNMPHGPVPKKYLLASLTAWTMNPHPDVKDMSKEIKHGLTKGSEFVRKWFGRCYSKFFPTQRPLEPQGPFLDGEQRLMLPSEILSQIQEDEGKIGAHVDPLEACLFLATLTRVHEKREFRNVRLALFVLENKDAEQKADFLLSWSVSEKWYAISMNDVDNKSFDDNKKNATRLLNDMLNKQPHILKDINTSGVYYNSKNTDIIALDFQKAASHFYIRGLP